MINKLTFRKTFLIYLKTNAKAKTLFKLMQIAKFFCFKEFPFFVVSEFGFIDDKWMYREPSEDRFDIFCLRTEFDKKVWITENFELKWAEEGDIQRLLPEIAVCDVEYLRLDNQIITLNELKFLTTRKVISIDLNKTIVKNENGEIIPVEILMKFVPSAITFSFTFNDETLSTLTAKSTESIIEVLKTSKINTFSLCELSEIFDFDAFCRYVNLKRNSKNYYYFHFRDDISDEYQQKVQTYFDEMNTEGFEKHYPINLDFPDHDCSFELTEKINLFLYGSKYPPNQPIQ